MCPSYRLSTPLHMEDAVAVVKWVASNASQLGGSSSGIFLSGHSAGANIAANLVCGHWLEDVLIEHPELAILGLIGISGVYTLFDPCDDSYFYNKAFDKMYRIPCFGKDIDKMLQHSPIEQIKLALGEDPWPRCFLNHLVNPRSHETAHYKDKSPLIKTRNDMCFLIMNAESDLGLDNCGRAFFEALKKLIKTDAELKVSYRLFGGTTHPSIALHESSLALACSFVKETYLKKNPL